MTSGVDCQHVKATGVALTEPDPDDASVRAYQSAVARARGFRLLGVLIAVMIGGIIVLGMCAVSAGDSWNRFIMETIH